MWQALLVALSLVAASCSAPVRLGLQAPATWTGEPSGYEEAVVDRVVDGDTIEVTITARIEGAGAGSTEVGRTYDVRLIGIDTPESVAPGSPVECFGPEASAATRALLDGRRVRLVKDVEEADGYQRLLRYVYIGAEMANARLVINGYASAYAYPPNVRHARLFTVLQRSARRGEDGLWHPSTCGGSG
jgi:micrococcal nuclease